MSHTPWLVVSNFVDSMRIPAYISDTTNVFKGIYLRKNIKVHHIPVPLQKTKEDGLVLALDLFPIRYRL